MKLARLGAAAACVALAGALARDARADDALGTAQSELVSVGRDMAGVQSVVERARTEQQTP